MTQTTVCAYREWIQSPICQLLRNLHHATALIRKNCFYAHKKTAKQTKLSILLGLMYPTKILATFLFGARTKSVLNKHGIRSRYMPVKKLISKAASTKLYIRTTMFCYENAGSLPARLVPNFLVKKNLFFTLAFYASFFFTSNYQD